jgi:hypothetical protein
MKEQLKTTDWTSMQEYVKKNLRPASSLKWDRGFFIIAKYKTLNTVT